MNILYKVLILLLNIVSECRRAQVVVRLSQGVCVSFYNSHSGSPSWEYRENLGISMLVYRLHISRSGEIRSSKN